AQYTAKFNNKEVSYPSGAVKQKLMEYDWPGNVRELQNVLQKSMILGNWEGALDKVRAGSSPSQDIEYPPPVPDNGRSVSCTVDLPDFNAGDLDGFSLKRSSKQATSLVEKEIISQVLKHTAWNRMKATKILKISYKTLLYKINDYSIKPYDNPEN
ncbi:MAG: hypothetical protein GY702_14880, partial [Desulfobulbaceae bacterium]|nr:hypothetical protein [Desulfobulbaceae bacterium]